MMPFFSITSRRRSALIAASGVTAIVLASATAFSQEPPAGVQRPARTGPPPRPASAPSKAPLAEAGQVMASQPAAPPSTLPNGAASITETYGSWTVDCRMMEGAKQCVLTQTQSNAQSGQRLFAIELNPVRDDRSEGVILMPFGLQLDSSAVLKLDDKDLGRGLRFSTCTPRGCLLPVSFPTVATNAMREARQLTVAALRLDNNEVLSFNIVMDGFGSAFERMNGLAR